MNYDPNHDELEAFPTGAYRVDQLCTAFELAWKSGKRGPIEEWLPRVPAAERPRLLHELILVEVELRRAMGDSPQAVEYQQRFPEHVEVVKDAFDATPPLRPTDPSTTATVIAEIGQDTSAGDFSTAGLVDKSEPLPEAIGRYPIRRVLGNGAFGRVYLGVDSRLDRLVAIKVALASQFETPIGRERFLREARNAAQLDHPGIVRVYDVEENGDLLYIVQHFIDGQNMAACAVHEHWSLDRIVRCISDVARAVAFAHQQGIFHCDLKPANILIDRQGHPHIADFGLAIDESSQRTRRGERAGTPRYMSPEQVRGEADRLDGRSDIWSLGVILYELATGRPPFDGANRDEVFDEILNREPKPPRMIDDKIPAELERIILRCLSKPVGGRYSTALEVARDLQKLGRRPRTWWWIAAAAVLVVAIGIVWRTWNHPADTSLESDLSGPIESFRVVHIREQAEEYEQLGEIGVDSSAARENDLVRIVARFREPLYCYLIAFNPDGSDQLCPRNMEDSKPQRLTALEYPVSKAYQLTDGTGLQAFAIVASREPLPTYREWRQQSGPMPWQHVEAGGVIRFDGRSAEETVPGKHQVSVSRKRQRKPATRGPSGGASRGQEVELKGVKPIEQLCGFLSEQSPSSEVQAVAFPVVAKPAQ
ncbi:MAG: serine/threonine protein kinase [Planctomycetes bacterium]|nr:serine/threonine protein kinase [Planctomycetota bacterium]